MYLLLLVVFQVSRIVFYVVIVFAFVDKEGIISESTKYVDEMAVIDQLKQKRVFDLSHDSHAT
jgi:hypothetical protein